MNRLLMFIAVFGVVVCSEQPQNPPLPTSPQFHELDDNSSDPSPRAGNVSSGGKSPAELQSALSREQKLKKELEEAQVLLAAKGPVANPSAIVVAATTPNPAVVAEQQRKLESSLFGPSGIFNILSPKIMDQSEAASKLIPALTVPGLKTNGQSPPLQLPGQAALPRLQQQTADMQFPQLQQPVINAALGQPSPFAAAGSQFPVGQPIQANPFGQQPLMTGQLGGALPFSATNGMPAINAFPQPQQTLSQFVPSQLGFAGRR